MAGRGEAHTTDKKEGIIMPYRTDLAAEADALTKDRLPDGVEQQNAEAGALVIHRVAITNETGAEAVGKPVGRYITVTAQPFSSAAELTEEEISAIAGELAAMLPKEGAILVVGLGNNDITPDAIGPRTVHQVLATRHIGEALAKESGLAGIRTAAAVAPGVLGQTGIETSEIIRALVEEISPAAVVVVDALAARSVSRLGRTIQIADTGISPGSGVMNARKELSEATLGVPVISVGVPTVVDASTLAEDLLSDQGGGESRSDLFQPEGRAMMITPREIAVLLGHACKPLALAINTALQPQMSLEELAYLAG
jgi:spore protease